MGLSGDVYMKEKISLSAIASLIISLVALALCVLTIERMVSPVLWFVFGGIAPFLPPLSKFYRSRTGADGDGLEIAALVIGLINFVVLLYNTTELSVFVIFGIAAPIAVYYAYAFNDDINWRRWTQGGHATYAQIACHIPLGIRQQLESRRGNPAAVQDYLDHCTRNNHIHRLAVDILRAEFAPAPQDAPSVPTPRFCRLCGHPLIENSRFCGKCGAAVPKEVYR